MTLATPFLVRDVLLAAASIFIVVAAYLKYSKSKSMTLQTGGTTAFAKVVDADNKIKDAEGKITALKDSAKVKQEAAAKLKEAAIEVHGELNKAHLVADEVHKILG